MKSDKYRQKDVDEFLARLEATEDGHIYCYSKHRRTVVTNVALKELDPVTNELTWRTHPAKNVLLHLVGHPTGVNSSQWYRRCSQPSCINPAHFTPHRQLARKAKEKPTSL